MLGSWRSYQGAAICNSRPSEHGPLAWSIRLSPFVIDPAAVSDSMRQDECHCVSPEPKIKREALLPSMAHDVFISHSTRDKTVADSVCSTLESVGIHCWMAPRDVRPGRS